MVQLNYPPPDGFLEEETRCEHLVSKKMKEIWAVEIDLAQQLLKVCKKNNLKIFADWGTALGTVRHKGFIPWDDDMDFCMFRNDYEKLRKIAKLEFKHPYYFEVGDDAEGFIIGGYAKLRNSQTTAIPKKDEKRNLKCNQGIFIDIYPLDNVPSNTFYFAIQKKLLRIFFVMSCGFAYFSTKYYEPSNVLIRPLTKFLHIIFRSPSKKLMKVSLALALKVAKFFNSKQTAKVASLSVSYFQTTMRNYYDNAFWMPFEYIHLPIIQAYDDLLKAEYGNYMVFKKYASEHEGMFCDPNRPYTDYVKGLK
jgi:lipopolysaccharide cholinephosphotransferase